jgi:signal transduction histidine kinase/CheY-like chemotaxis protein
LQIALPQNNLPLGELTLVLNPDYFWNSFLELAAETALGYSLLICVICLLIFYILRRDLERPLQTIANFAANLTSENLTTPLLINRHKLSYEDEITQLANGFSKLQIKLREHIDDLNHLISERTINQKKLEAANQESQSANLAKSQFLATVSHELRTPLNGILGMAQILQKPHLDESQRQEYAQIIIDSSKALNLLIGDLLDITQIEANKLVLRSEPCNVQAITQDIAALFQENAKAKNLELKVTWNGPENQNYRADGLRLRQMISNLVSNAIKFTSSGFIHIESSEIERSGAEAMLMISVTDSGIGIPNDKLNLLFKRFSQIDSTHSRMFMGTGLGLSIVESLAKRMGGEVGVESVLGKGSRFWFKIQTVLLDGQGAVLLDFPKLEDIKTPPFESAQASNGFITDSQKPQQNRFVMVVEDNPINQKIVGNVLTRMGARIEYFNNGLDAVNAMTQGASKPQLILMDMQMPIMDGLCATQEIRKWETSTSQRRTPIIGLTAGSGESSAHECIQSGMDEVLFKPVDLDVLQNAINKLIN